MNRLKVFSYNIHKGFSARNRNYTLKKIREEIRKRHPDIIFLQEIHGHHSEHKKNIADWPDASQFEFLAEELWPHFTYGKNAIYTKGHHGNAILSKFPIQSSENLDISKNRFEHRGLLHTIIQVSKNSPPLHAVCIHLGLFEGDRKKQLKDLVHRIEKMIPPHEPIIAAGDFNDWRATAGGSLKNSLGLKEAFQKLHGDFAKTFPAFFPFLPLDRIYYRGFEVLTARCHTTSPWSGLSDHAPLEAEFAFER